MRLGTAALALLAATACGTASADDAAGPTVRLTVRYSHFSRSVIRVPRGVPVRFVTRNDDPIDHELIVGDLGVQLRHEQGTERRHGARPTERSVTALTTDTTTITFDRAGTVFFACHLPGHYAYGMRGEIQVYG